SGFRPDPLIDIEVLAFDCAGWYNHYGRVWVLKTAPGAGNVFSG
ncbi:hypothetical protein ACUODF_14905, partial [Escherichia coli]